jgi:hypothetical protein
MTALGTPATVSLIVAVTLSITTGAILYAKIERPLLNRFHRAVLPS